MGQMFTCCIDGGEPRNVRSRPRIDRSMIGSPTDFRHTAHIGSNDVYGGSNDNFGLLQTQMKSKGGYSVMVNQVPYVPHIINARNLDEVRRKWHAAIYLKWRAKKGLFETRLTYTEKCVSIQDDCDKYSQCGNMKIFWPFRFYVKSESVNQKKSKMSPTISLNIDFGNFCAIFRADILQKQSPANFDFT